MDRSIFHIQSGLEQLGRELPLYCDGKISSWAVLAQQSRILRDVVYTEVLSGASALASFEQSEEVRQELWGARELRQMANCVYFGADCLDRRPQPSVDTFVDGLKRHHLFEAFEVGKYLNAFVASAKALLPGLRLKTIDQAVKEALEASPEIVTPRTIAIEMKRATVTDRLPELAEGARLDADITIDEVMRAVEMELQGLQRGAIASSLRVVFEPTLGG